MSTSVFPHKHDSNLSQWGCDFSSCYSVILPILSSARANIPPLRCVQVMHVVLFDERRPNCCHKCTWHPWLWCSFPVNALAMAVSYMSVKSFPIRSCALPTTFVVMRVPCISKYTVDCKSRHDGILLRVLKTTSTCWSCEQCSCNPINVDQMSTKRMCGDLVVMCSRISFILAHVGALKNHKPRVKRLSHWNLSFLPNCLWPLDNGAFVHNAHPRETNHDVMLRVTDFRRVCSLFQLSSGNHPSSITK